VSQEICMCGHAEFRHEERNYTGHEARLSTICWECDEDSFKKYHEFKLDNLKLIEDTAKHRGLI